MRNERRNYKGALCRLTDKAGHLQGSYSTAHRPLLWSHVVQEYTDMIPVHMQGRWSLCTPVHEKTDNRFTCVTENICKICAVLDYIQKIRVERDATEVIHSIFRYNLGIFLKHTHKNQEVISGKLVPRQNLNRVASTYKNDSAATV